MTIRSYFVPIGCKTFLVFLALAIFGRAQPAPAALPLKVGVEIDASPLSFVGPDGRPAGYSIDLIDAIAREMNFSVVYVQAPWPKIFGHFTAGEIDAVASLVYTAERDRYIDYSVPHLTMKGVAFLRRGGPAVSVPADLANVRVAIQRNSFSQEFLRTRGWDRQPVFITTLTEALQAIDTGRCDAVLAAGLVGQKIIRDLRLTHVVASNLPFPELDFNLHMGVRAGDSDHLALLNAGLARIKANGVYVRIHEKWIGPLEPRELHLHDFKNYLLPGLIFVLGLAAAFIWQRRLLNRFRAQAAALQASEQRLKLVLEVGAHGLWVYDFETALVERDAATAATLTGYSPAELAADPGLYRSRIHPEDRSVMEASRQHNLRPGNDEVAHDYRLQHKDGDWRWISTRGRVIARKPDGTAIRSVGTNTDITHLKAQETERAQLQAKMLEAQKLESLGVLAGGIAHDFNNLLAVVLGNAGLARLSTPADNTEALLSLGQIELAARRASDLCRQMLAYAGHGSLARERLSLGALITNTTDLLRLSISKNATLTFDLDPTAPWVEADRSQMQQIMMNLVINASEALGTAPGTIRLATGRSTPDPLRLTDLVYRPERIAGEFAWIEVADTGCGMTPETRAKIFEPFFTTKFTGRGLGLAAVLGIVRAHRGIFTLSSTPGQGSTFRIYLPAADPAAVLAPNPPAPVAVQPSGTVLVADDEPAVLAMATKTLERHGYRVVPARDGREAVQQFTTQPDAFCAVLLDLTMPVLDGAQALREIRALRPAAPLLVMSGYGQQATLQKLRDAGRVDFLTKPFSTEQLLAAVAQLRQA